MGGARKGICTPERSVWLDHISDLLVITFGKATRYSHFNVMQTIFGFLMLKLAALASTGLFFQANTQVGPLSANEADNKVLQCLSSRPV